MIFIIHNRILTRFISLVPLHQRQMEVPYYIIITMSLLHHSTSHNDVITEQSKFSLKIKGVKLIINDKTLIII